MRYMRPLVMVFVVGWLSTAMGRNRPLTDKRRTG